MGKDIGFRVEVQGGGVLGTNIQRVIGQQWKEAEGREG